MNKAFFFFGILIATAVPTTVANASILKSYELNDGYFDSLGNGLDLVANNGGRTGGTLGGGRYTFGENAGFGLDLAFADTANYGVEFRLRVDVSVNGYNKLIDFQGLGRDAGLYIVDGDITFNPSGPRAGNLSVGTDYTIGFELIGGVGKVFLDGNFLYSFVDSGNEAISNANEVYFFRDDLQTVTQNFAGSVDWIRIHDDSSTFYGAGGGVPEPASVIIWSVFGCCGLAGGAYRRKKAKKQSEES